MSIACRLSQLLLVLAFLPLFETSVLAQQDADEQNNDPNVKRPPVVELAHWRGHQIHAVVSEGYFMNRRPVPARLESAEEARKYFKQEIVARWEKQVDFGRQDLVVMSCGGSGQNKIVCYVSLSKPFKVMFIVEPGSTKDLVEQVSVYAIGKDVKLARDEAFRHAF